MKSFKSAEQARKIAAGQEEKSSKPYCLTIMTNQLSLDILLPTFDTQNKWNYHFMKACKEAEVLRKRRKTDIQKVDKTG